MALLSRQACRSPRERMLGRHDVLDLDEGLGMPDSEIDISHRNYADCTGSAVDVGIKHDLDSTAPLTDQQIRPISADHARQVGA